MSGESVVLGDQGGQLAKLVHAIARIEREDLPRHALIGGIAVIARLQQRHRATADVDEVFLEDEGDAIQILLDKKAKRQKDGVILETGERVDFIAVSGFDPRDLPDDALQRAFVLSHHWALMTATRLQLVVSGAHGSPLADASTPVARTESLVAMKLAAAPTRREGVSFKRATDLFDIYRLLGSFDVDRAVARAVRGAPHDLPALVRRLAQGLLVDDAQRSVRWMLTEGGPEMQGVTAEDLRAVGEPFVAALGQDR